MIATISVALRVLMRPVEQKTRTVYISQSQLPNARRMLANYAKMRKLTEELLEVNIAIFKGKSKL